MHAVLNISAYRFTVLADPGGWARQIRVQAAERGLLGTAILAAEGINLFVAGPEAGAQAFLDWLQQQAPFAGIAAKLSHSHTVPFGRLIVKVKAEIIRMSRPAVAPQGGRAPAVDAPTLARWLDAGCDDQGRDVVMLDTRNCFEVDHGRFRGALDWRLKKFSDFPQALSGQDRDFGGCTVVTYCTGGIRCEKAALYMRERDLPEVLQLEGGILGYFAATGGAAPGWRGDCFVFDERTALAPDLRAEPGAAA